MDIEVFIPCTFKLLFAISGVCISKSVRLQPTSIPSVKIHARTSHFLELKKSIYFTNALGRFPSLDLERIVDDHRGALKLGMNLPSNQRSLQSRNLPRRCLD